MDATAWLKLVPEVDEGRTEGEGERESIEFARGTLLSEIPGLAIGLMTLFYLASSLIGLM
jgi:hypothetical protein